MIFRIILGSYLRVLAQFVINLTDLDYYASYQLKIISYQTANKQKFVLFVLIEYQPSQLSARSAAMWNSSPYLFVVGPTLRICLRRIALSAT